MIISKNWLVVRNTNFSFPYIGNVIIPIRKDHENSSSSCSVFIPVPYVSHGGESEGRWLSSNGMSTTYQPDLMIDLSVTYISYILSYKDIYIYKCIMFTKLEASFHVRYSNHSHRFPRFPKRLPGFVYGLLRRCIST